MCFSAIGGAGVPASRMLCVALILAGGSAVSDSLFKQSEQYTGTTISEKKARFEVGDIITVLVRENIEASTQADTNTRKESDVETEADGGDNALLTSPKPNGYGILQKERLPNWAIETDNEHRARGLTQRSNELVTTVSCFVTQLYKNDNIAIEGERKLGVNREESHIYVSGIIRAEDVTPANTIESNKIANATVELRGRGPLWNNQRRNIVMRVLDWISP